MASSQWFLKTLLPVRTLRLNTLIPNSRVGSNATETIWNVFTSCWLVVSFPCVNPLLMDTFFEQLWSSCVVFVILGDFITCISLFSLFWDFEILSVSLILILSVREGPGSCRFCLFLISKQWEGILGAAMFWFYASTGKGMVRAISSFLNWKQMNVALNLGGGLAFCHLNNLRLLFWGTRFWRAS